MTITKLDFSLNTTELYVNLFTYFSDFCCGYSKKNKILLLFDSSIKTCSCELFCYIFRKLDVTVSFLFLFEMVLVDMAGTGPCVFKH